MTEAPALGGLPVIRPTPIICAPRSAQGLTLMSDLHIGSSQVYESLILQELKAARRNRDRVLLGGDVFDLILPSDRKRYSPSAVHPRLRGRNDLVNAAVEMGTELLAPYADLIDVVGQGNHETAAIHNGSVDAVRLLVQNLNTVRDKALKPIAQPGYTAFIEYRLFAVEGAARPAGRYVVWFTHGAGKTNKAALALKGLVDKTHVFEADLYWSGHSHARVNCTESKIKCGRNGRPVGRDVKCVITGAYTLAYAAQSQASTDRRGPKSNYASEAAMAPHGLGGARVVLRWDRPGYPDRVEVIQ